MASNKYEKAGKAAVKGGASSALVGAGVGSLFGRAAIFAGMLPGVGAPAALALGVIGGIAGAVAGAVVGATSDDD